MGVIGLCECIRTLGATATTTGDGLHIEERSDLDYPEDVRIDCKGDPWIFMSMALAAGCLPRPIVLDDEKCAEKVYRHFLRDYKALGGKYEIL